jgi:hypothetical protein
VILLPLTLSIAARRRGFEDEVVFLVFPIAAGGEGYQNCDAGVNGNGEGHRPRDDNTPREAFTRRRTGA